MPGVDSDPSRAPRRATDEQAGGVKSTLANWHPGKRTRTSFAEPKSTSRSTQSSNTTSVSLVSRKFTESSLQLRNRTRRPITENAWTPANTDPLNQASVSDDSAMSTATSRVSPNHTSENRERRNRPPSKPAPAVKAHSVTRAPPAA